MYYNLRISNHFLINNIFNKKINRILAIITHQNLFSHSLTFLSYFWNCMVRVLAKIARYLFKLWKKFDGVFLCYPLTTPNMCQVCQRSFCTRDVLVHFVLYMQLIMHVLVLKSVVKVTLKILIDRIEARSGLFCN